MTRRRSRRRSARRQGVALIVTGTLLIVAVLAALGGGFYLLIEARRTHVALDPETYCPKNGARAVTAVLIDTTDPLDLVQRTDLDNQLAAVVADVPRFGLLELYTVARLEDEQPKPLFHKCNPGNADEVSGLIENPRRVRMIFEQGFRQPLERVLGAMLDTASADRSPILESIQWIAVNSLSRPEQSSLPRRLVLISDLLQHTAGFSLYRSRPDFAAFARGRYYRRIQAPLQGVDVDLIMVRRETRKNRQGSALIRFWRDYFDAQGVRRLRLVRLAG